MITFKQFLSEARLAPLYHGTTVKHAIAILEEDELSPKTFQNSFNLLKTPFKFEKNVLGHPYPVGSPGTVKRIWGVSTSRNLNFSKKWVALNHETPFDETVVFELDQRKLTHRYQIKPINFFMKSVGPSQNEYEEFIITERPIPIGSYLTKIHVFSNYARDKIYTYVPVRIPIKVHSS